MFTILQSEVSTSLKWTGKQNMIPFTNLQQFCEKLCTSNSVRTTSSQELAFLEHHI